MTYKQKYEVEQLRKTKGNRMKDRFKFRVWNKVRQYFMTEKEMFICGNGELFLIDEALSKTWVKNNLNYKVSFCTGLKDKNGKLIYEGDILGGSYENLYVHYCDSCKQFQLKANDYGCMACEGDIHWYELVESENENEIEVIGNIYENKEL